MLSLYNGRNSPFIFFDLIFYSLNGVWRVKMKDEVEKLVIYNSYTDMAYYSY